MQSHAEFEVLSWAELWNLTSGGDMPSSITRRICVRSWVMTAHTSSIRCDVRWGKFQKMHICPGCPAVVSACPDAVCVWGAGEMWRGQRFLLDLKVYSRVSAEDQQLVLVGPSWHDLKKRKKNWKQTHMHRAGRPITWWWLWMVNLFVWPRWYSAPMRP